jgi:hypothetical protein
MTMRILFIIDGLPGGGAEKVVLTLAETFLRQGDEVSLFHCATSANILCLTGSITGLSPINVASPGVS